jgi:hypothetical protein
LRIRRLDRLEEDTFGKDRARNCRGRKKKKAAKGRQPLVDFLSEC